MKIKAIVEGKLMDVKVTKKGRDMMIIYSSGQLCNVICPEGHTVDRSTVGEEVSVEASVNADFVFAETKF